MTEEWHLDLEDNEWPLTTIDHDRMIARAIVVDDEGYFYFVRANRDDDFGKATLIETAGGGVEAGEDLDTAIRRELKEELGADVEVLGKIGVVSDYYNLIHRHNVNNYFLCKVKSFGEKHLTQDEIEDFHLSTLKFKYEEALAEYERCRCTSLGRLVASREVPVLKRAKELLQQSAAERIVDDEIKLIPYYRNDEISLPWYQDPDVCKQVDNRDEPYDLELLHRMYDFLSSHGNCYYIEYKGTLVGDVSLRDNAEVAIVVCKEYQNHHIGRRCIEDMLKLAKEKGMDTVKANIYSFNKQSQCMFEAVGFKKTDEEWYEFKVM